MQMMAMHPATRTLPAGACDCHVHVIGEQSQYPMLPERHYTPGPAPHADLLAHMKRHGLQRAVIVQPSVYGTDNRCLLASLEQMQGMGRGVAVVDDDVEQATLVLLHARGVRGLRVNVESAGIRDAGAVANALSRWAERLAPLGWHLQIYASLDTVAGAAAHLFELAVPVVLDHFAMLPASTPHDDARALAVLSLLRADKAYLKLSAPYRLDAAGMPANSQVDRWAAAFVQAAPHRVLWGSDWPHTNREPGRKAHELSAYREVPDEALDTAIHRWFPGEALLQQVLVTNPAQLYGF